MADTRELVLRARRGDAAAFEALVRSHYRAAYATALAQLGNPMNAEDAVQDAFIRALERLDQCQPERFAGWLLQIVRNRAHNVRDYERVRSAQPLDTIEASGPERTERHAEQAELRDRLQQALAELPPAQREVVLLHDLEGWRHREIGEALGISEVMARQHLFNARRTLRRLLGQPALKEYIND